MVSFAHLRLPGDWYRLPNGTREGGKGTRNVARRHAGRRQRPTASDLRTDSDPIRRLSDASSGRVCESSDGHPVRLRLSADASRLGIPRMIAAITRTLDTTTGTVTNLSAARRVRIKVSLNPSCWWPLVAWPLTPSRFGPSLSLALVFGKSPRISAHCSAAIRSISAFSAASRAFRRGAQRADLFMFSRLWHRF